MAQDKAGDILAALEEASCAHGVSIVDVEVVGATKAPTVRVRIEWADDERNPISLDDVASQTRWISEKLDEVDPFPGSFTLEVSSPGLDRPLRRPEDFERYAGSEVALSTTAVEGRKRFSGKLCGLRDGSIVLETEEGEVTVALAELRRCTIKPDFSASGSPSKKSK